VEKYLSYKPVVETSMGKDIYKPIADKSAKTMPSTFLAETLTSGEVSVLQTRCGDFNEGQRRRSANPQQTLTPPAKTISSGVFNEWRSTANP